MIRGSRQGVRYAVIGFVLISLVALGGMSWATVASWRLAEWNINQERLTCFRDAAERMDNYVLGILKVEAGRQYWEYVPWHTPEVVLTADRQFIDPRTVQLPSPLLSNRPQHDWIELYFQASDKGEWSSPHLTYEDLSLVTDNDGWSQAATNRARKTLGWLMAHITIRDLQSRLEAGQGREGVPSSETDSVETTLAQMRPVSTGLIGLARFEPRGEFRPAGGRARDPRSLQQKFIPQTRCVPQDIADENVRPAGGEVLTAPDDVLQPPDIEVRLTPLIPIWLTGHESGETRIAFVRTVDKALETVFQGFVGDWGRLRQELLRRVQDLLPDADLVPVLDGSHRHFTPGSVSAYDMEQLPARLTAGSAFTASTEAWRSIRGVLLVSWAGVLAVLAAAGWGIRNLVSLTERRLQFAYAVTHELRTPLTTFRLYTDMLAAGLVPEEKQQEYIDTLNRESQRLSTLVEDVLEYARLENQKLRLNPMTVQGDELLRRLSETQEQRCRANGVRADARNDIPPDEPIRTDVDLVTQIAGVLINNAVRHAKSSKQPAVLVHLARENGALHVNVIDSGSGVDRADARSIFKPFRRGRNADATAQGGIGLGLSLARNWATLLGGRLDLVARRHPGMGGAHFRLTIPVRSET